MNKHVKAALNPTAAPGYFTSGGSRNWEPALLWLLLAVIGLNTLRMGKLPTGSQAVGWAVLTGGVVLAGAFAPELVALALVGLLVAGALNTHAPLADFVQKLTGRLPTLSTQ